MEVDLSKQLKIPAQITLLWLRPDKQLIMLELAVPGEDNMDEANERKHAKYQELLDAC